MSKTSLTDTDTCSYNISAAPFFWIFQENQGYNNTFSYGEVGISAASNYIRPDVVDISSFLSGRDEILSRCNPPVPGLDEIKNEPLKMQDDAKVDMLISKYTREKRSANELSAIDYNRWQPNLPTDPQDIRFIIEDMAPQRGGMDTSNYSKLAWNPKVKYGAAVDGDKGSCRTILDPSRACGEHCAPVNGYNPDILAMPLDGKPPGQPNYPFNGPTSQDVKSVGAASCGPNQFYGSKYDKGSCGSQPVHRVLMH